MAQIGNIQEIIIVKKHLSELKDKGFIKEWELPYENILTRLTAAIFFLTPKKDEDLSLIWEELSIHKMLKYKKNKEQKISGLMWRVEFNEGYEI